jgi:hypothetical protein
VRPGLFQRREAPFKLDRLHRTTLCLKDTGHGGAFLR